MNSMNQNFRDIHEETFHRIEFWSKFVFTIVTLFSFIFAPKGLSVLYQDTNKLKFMIFMNVIFAFVPAALITIDLEVFEV